MPEHSSHASPDTLSHTRTAPDAHSRGWGEAMHRAKRFIKVGTTAAGDQESLICTGGDQLPAAAIPSVPSVVRTNLAQRAAVDRTNNQAEEFLPSLWLHTRLLRALGHRLRT